MQINGKILLKRKNKNECDENKGAKTMCKKIAEINGLTPEKLLEFSGQSEKFPVDVSQICYSLGIRLMPFDFTPIEQQLKETVKSKGNILGAVVANNDDLAILYRQDDATNRKRFTIAHELAHSCLHMQPTEQEHIEFRTDKHSSDKKEIEANIFAGKLLIPEKHLRQLIGERNFLFSNDLYYLSRIFMVSENVMKARLEYLNIKIFHSHKGIDAYE